MKKKISEGQPFFERERDSIANFFNFLSFSKSMHIFVFSKFGRGSQKFLREWKTQLFLDYSAFPFFVFSKFGQSSQKFGRECGSDEKIVVLTLPGLGGSK